MLVLFTLSTIMMNPYEHETITTKAAIAEPAIRFHRAEGGRLYYRTRYWQLLDAGMHGIRVTDTGNSSTYDVYFHGMGMTWDQTNFPPPNKIKEYVTWHTRIIVPYKGEGQLRLHVWNFGANSIPPKVNWFKKKF